MGNLLLLILFILALILTCLCRIHARLVELNKKAIPTLQMEDEDDRS